MVVLGTVFAKSIEINYSIKKGRKIIMTSQISPKGI
jgi:hypothetical protein